VSIGPTEASPGDSVFDDEISRNYERHLVPLIFEPYAGVLAERLAGFNVSSVLELAAGTGVLTRALASRFPASVSITATDLNQAMLDQAAFVGTSRPVGWRQADALRLPFDDAAFDAVVCQFGVMFFPDKLRAFSEARRVLVPGGVFLFSVWDRIEENEFADVVTSSLASMFPGDPPQFLRRTPHGYFDGAVIAGDLAGGGFMSAANMETIAARSRAPSAEVPAIAYCHGTPLRNEIEARAPGRLREATEMAADAVRQRFGDGVVDGRTQAHIVSASK